MQQQQQQQQQQQHNDSAPPIWIQQPFSSQGAMLPQGAAMLSAGASGGAPAAWAGSDAPVGSAPFFCQPMQQQQQQHQQQQQLPQQVTLMPAGFAVAQQSPPQAGNNSPPGSAGNSGTTSVSQQQPQQQQQFAAPPGFVPVLLANGQQAFMPAGSLQMAPQAPVVWQNAGGPTGGQPMQFAIPAPNNSNNGNTSANGSVQSVSMAYATMQESPGNSTASVPHGGNSMRMNASGSGHQGQQQPQTRVKTPPPAPGEDERGPRQLIVNYLPPTASDRDLRQIFSQIGPVEVARISRDSNGASKAFGFVYFRSTDDARRAIDALNGFSWLNKRIKVEWATQRGPHPPGTSRYRPPSVPTGYVPKGPASGGSSLTAVGGAMGVSTTSDHDGASRSLGGTPVTSGSCTGQQHQQQFPLPPPASNDAALPQQQQ
jgi:hypothetical protein